MLDIAETDEKPENLADDFLPQFKNRQSSEGEELVFTSKKP